MLLNKSLHDCIKLLFDQILIESSYWFKISRVGNKHELPVFIYLRLYIWSVKSTGLVSRNMKLELLIFLSADAFKCSYHICSKCNIVENNYHFSSLRRGCDIIMWVVIYLWNPSRRSENFENSTLRVSILPILVIEELTAVLAFLGKKIPLCENFKYVSELFYYPIQHNFCYKSTILYFQKFPFSGFSEFLKKMIIFVIRKETF